MSVLSHILHGDAKIYLMLIGRTYVLYFYYNVYYPPIIISYLFKKNFKDRGQKKKNIILTFINII